MQLHPEGEVRSERKISADTRISEEGEGGGASGKSRDSPAAREEELLQPYRGAEIHLQSLEVHGGADIHLEPMEDSKQGDAQRRL